MPKTNIKQATLIPSATSLPNPNGTAPGWFVSKDSKIVIAMPGPPIELIAMWKNHVAPKLDSLSDGIAISTKNLKTFGRSEGELDELLSDLFKQENPYLGIYSKQDGIHLRAIAKSSTITKADSLINKIQGQIRDKVGDGFIWGTDDDIPSEVATNLLHSKALRLCVTESYTGGVVCSLLSECINFEKVFFRGTVNSPISLHAADYIESQATCGEGCKADIHLNISPLLIEEKDRGSVFGDVNITTSGTVRELIKGDYHLEVEGDYTQKIHKNHRIKVGAGEGGGNREEEIRGNHAYQINGAVKGRITGNVDTIIEKSEVRIINDTSSLSVQNAIKIVATGPTYADTLLTSGDITIVANNNLSTTTISGITSFKSGDKLNVKSADAMVIKSEDSITESSETTLDSTAGTIYTIKSGGGTPTATNIVTINP